MQTGLLKGLGIMDESAGRFREEVLRGYGELRAEMLQKIDLHNKLLLFVYTSTAALLASPHR